MNKFPMLVFAFGLPLLGFMVLKDGSGTIYSSKANGLSYQIIDPEELEEEVAEVTPEVVVEAPVVADPVAPEPEPVDAPIPAAPVEDDVVKLAAALTEEELIAGKKEARACTSCHQLERERNAVGPHLVGIGGRLVGSVEGFKYSDALIALGEAGEVWTAEAMEEWLIDPSAFADGTKMNFKVRDAAKRRLIAGYLTNQ